jgi:hypothetical protein
MTILRLRCVRALLLAMGTSCALLAQQTAHPDSPIVPEPFQNHSSSGIAYSVRDGAEIVEIQNTTYEVTGTHVPGRPPEERLIVRKSLHSKEILDEVGMDATTTFEAWPLGADLQQKALYTLTLMGSDGRRVDNALLEVSRGLEEVEWWSVYKLGTGQHLFDTYVPLVRFSISRETPALRYVGLEVPPDDAADTRLRDPHVVAVLSYASADGLIREALLTCDDPKQAQALRSYADEERSVLMVEKFVSATRGRKGSEPSRSIRIYFRSSYPSPAATLEAVIPLSADDLDLSHARLPAHLHLAAWQR